MNMNIEQAELGDLQRTYEMLAESAMLNCTAAIYARWEEHTQSLVDQPAGGSKLLYIIYDAARMAGMSQVTAAKWTALQLADAINDKNREIERLTFDRVRETTEA